MRELTKDEIRLVGGGSSAASIYLANILGYTSMRQINSAVHADIAKALAESQRNIQLSS